MTSAGRDKLLSVLEHLQRNPSTQVLILDLGVESRLWAARLGVEMANFGEVLEAKSARLKATPREVSLLCCVLRVVLTLRSYSGQVKALTRTSRS